MVRNFLKGAVIAVLVAASAGAAGTAAVKKTAKFKPTRPYVEGEVIVQFKGNPEAWEARQAHQKVGGTPLKVLKKLNLVLVQLPPGMDTVKGVEAYRKIPAVATAEPNYVTSPLKKSPK